jgi:hypothetical protein
MHNTHKKFLHDTYSTVIVVSLNHSLFKNFTTTLTFWYQVTILTVLELTFCIAVQVERVVGHGPPGGGARSLEPNHTKALLLGVEILFARYTWLGVLDILVCASWNYSSSRCIFMNNITISSEYY